MSHSTRAGYNAGSMQSVLSSLPWYERAIQAVAPSWGFKRLQARVERHLFEYQAAQTDRLFAPAQFSPPSESVRTTRDRIVMMYEARDLVENFESAKTALGKFASFTVPTEWSPNTGDEKYDGLLAEWFHEEWCKQCDFTGRHSFRTLLELAVQMQPVDGDNGFIERSTDDGLRLQLTPADLIGNPNRIVNSATYFSGISVNDHGAPVFYDIWKRNNEGVYTDHEEISARFFRHYFNPFRVDQYRGITEFHSVIRTMRMMKETLEAERVAQRHKSQHAAIVFNERGQAPVRQAFQAQPPVTMPNGEPQLQEYSGVGTVLYLSRGDKVETMPARPGEGFMDFMGYGDHLIARGLDIPYGVLFGTSGFKGPNVRAEFAQADRVFDRRRGTLTSQAASPIKDDAIIDAIARGRLPMPKAKTGEDIVATLMRATRGEWRFPPKPSIDAGRDSTANLNENRQGLKSGQQIASENGYDYRQALRQKAQEAAMIRDLAKEYGVPETAISLPTQTIPQTVAGAASLGEGAGDAAAAAQKESANRAASATSPESPEGSPSDADSEEKLSAKERVQLRLRGPAARRGQRLSIYAARHTRLATVRRALGDQTADVDDIKSTFERLAK